MPFVLYKFSSPHACWKGKWQAVRGEQHPQNTHTHTRTFVSAAILAQAKLILIVLGLGCLCNLAMGAVCQRFARPLEPASLDQAPLVQRQPMEATVPLSAGVVVPRCTTPCPCCFYTLSTVQNGRYTMGWRKFGGQWSWWHRGGPHAFVDRCNVALGINAPGTPACACCYYRTLVPGTVGPGWFLDHNGRWRWAEFQAPHASGFAWDVQVDDARYMQGRPSQGDAGPVQAQFLSDMQELAWQSWMQDADEQPADPGATYSVPGDSAPPQSFMAQEAEDLVDLR